MGWSGFVNAFLNVEIAVQWFPSILDGLILTIFIGVCVVITGICAGLALAVIRRLGIAPINWIIIFFIDVFRTIPGLVLIVLFYFGLPSAGVTISGEVSTWLALSLVLMAFSEEIFWAGITSIPRGQWDAARSTGLNFGAALRYVVLPQAIRITVPPLTNRTIAITKGVALASVVAVQDVLGAAQTAVTFSFNGTPLLLAAVVYLLLFWPLIILARRLEAKLAWGRCQ
ncbi:amino acid ABC transporter permease [Limibacillus sp. MBR-115]|jgi:polar amino acid transport system permease protein|uniref:amino acid ABC transporter permease n=1 Tax=Limibacillus sp. MBR-115 TaxID=3156465 RepID=UPI003391A4AC